MVCLKDSLIFSNTCQLHFTKECAFKIHISTVRSGCNGTTNSGSLPIVSGTLILSDLAHLLATC